MFTNSLDVAVAERSATGPTADPPPAEAVITVRGLVKRYDDHEAVRGIDLEVRRGEIFAFLGPNGAGKTTTVEILEGFREATAGTVEVLGEDPASAPRAWRDRIGIVLQESQAESLLSVRECIELYAGCYLTPLPVDHVLALVGLEDRAQRRTEQLSGGERRRLDVALALVGDPDLIFLDEPTTGFDPSARRAAWDVIAGLRDLGKTVLLTTHYMEEAERLADRIAVIAAGEIIELGTPATLGGRDRAAVEIAFSLPDGLPSDLAAELSGHIGVTDGRVVLTSDRARLAGNLHAISGWALEDDVDLVDLEVRRPTLEDTYLALTGAADHDQRSHS
jgi:ABC-2 type transport system ATP-binding protein